MLNQRQKDLIKKAVINQIEILKDLGYELSIPPVAERKHLNQASHDIINTLPKEIAEYEQLRKLLDKVWPLDK